MLCDICKEKEATVHLTQMVEGKTKKIDLCEGCSKAKGVDDPAGFSLADLLLGLGASQEMEESDATKEKCPQCGFSQADFKKTGRLGCPACYDHFKDGVDGLQGEGLETGLKCVARATLSLVYCVNYGRLR